MTDGTRTDNGICNSDYAYSELFYFSMEHETDTQDFISTVIPDIQKLFSVSGGFCIVYYFDFYMILYNNNNE